MLIKDIDAAQIGMRGKARVIEFDGLAEMVRASVAATKTHAGLMTFGLEEADWIGRRFGSWDEVTKAVDGTWQQGVDRIEELAAIIGREQLPRPTVIKRRRVWNDSAGADVCIDRYRAGDPFRREPHRVRTPGPRVVTILTQCGQNCNMSSDSLFWRGALAVVLSRMVEDAGYRAEIKAFTQAESTWSDGTNMLSPVVLKGAADHLDIASLANATSGWFFRTVTFASWLTPGKSLSYGLGRQKELTPEASAYMAGNAWRWEVTRVYDQTSAVALARKLLAELVLQAA